MNKFEQLIEYVINDEDQKARELFHDIVVAKSREIYENLMQEEAEEDLDEAEVNEADDSDDEEADDDELDEGAMGGDASDDLIDEIEADEEQDMSMEAEGDDEMGDDDMADDEGGDFGGDDMGGDDMGGSDEPATKDDVMNLEDKLDELMAEFEGLMGGDDMGDMGDGDGFGPDEGGDAIEMDDTGEMEPGMMEAISMKAAPKPVTAEQGNGKAGPVAFNSGAAGMASKPVHTGTSMGGVHDSAAYRNTVKELGVTPTQDAGKKAFKSAAPAPVKSQASGVNTKSPLPSGRKG